MENQIQLHSFPYSRAQDPYILTDPVRCDRFVHIDSLEDIDRFRYRQIEQEAAIRRFRRRLLSLLEDDLRKRVLWDIAQWAQFGISANEVQPHIFRDFVMFYETIMKKYAVVKNSYSKVDFAACGICPEISNPAVLNAKLDAFQIFRASYQLGEPAMVSNFRFMYNPPSKSDGKYREWMLHFDNSNYAPEFKLIVTRRSGTLDANQDQCLAAFPYDMTQAVRFTRCEQDTKFHSISELERELLGVPGACYALVRNRKNEVPLEVGLRTEMIVHHRSASFDNTNGEPRDADLLTFHGMNRCAAFLSQDQLNSMSHLNPLQRHVLGGFVSGGGEDAFLDALAAKKDELNRQWRDCLARGALRTLEDLTVARYARRGIEVLDAELYVNQQKTYDALPSLIDRFPKLGQQAPWPQRLFEIVPDLMNFDQNARMMPDCSENRAVAARTQLRERENAQFLAPLVQDAERIRPSADAQYRMSMARLVFIAGEIANFYKQLLGSGAVKNDDFALFLSRHHLALDYTTQLTERVSIAESHQVIVLFIYYMLADVEMLMQTRYTHSQGALFANSAVTQNRIEVLQHFVSYRMWVDTRP